MLYSVSQTVAVVVGVRKEYLVVNGSFLEDLVPLMEVENLPQQLLTSVEVEDPVQFSRIEGTMLLDQKDCIVVM